MAAGIVGMAAGAASAATEVVDFSIDTAAAQFQSGDAYGIPQGPPLTGSFTVTLPGTLGSYWETTDGITAFDFTAGTKTWTLSDLDPGLTAGFIAVHVGDYSGVEQVDDFELWLAPGYGTYLFGDATGTAGNAVITDPLGGVVGCNACLTYNGPVGVEIAGIPEPATWAMMIAGVGLMGSTLRRRTSGNVTAPA